MGYKPTTEEGKALRDMALLVVRLVEEEDWPEPDKRKRLYLIIDKLMKTARLLGATGDDLAQALGLKDWEALAHEAMEFTRTAPPEMLVETMEIMDYLEGTDAE